MQREIIITKDGSHTVSIDGVLTYHSIHGAVQESTHVFINAGLIHFLNTNNKTEINILEMGFGTGLNALLVLHFAAEKNILINYTSVEKFPLNSQEVTLLNYGNILNDENSFTTLHNAEWNTPVQINKNFTLEKINTPLEEFASTKKYDIIFYDAFAPTAQPELWTEAIFKKLYDTMNTGGILVTYCSKSIVRKALQAAGFTVEKIQGPPGKREMLRAIRL